MATRNVRSSTQLLINSAFRNLCSSTSLLILFVAASVVIFFVVTAGMALLPDRIDSTSRVILDVPADDVLAVQIGPRMPARLGWIVRRDGRIQLFDRETGVPFERSSQPLSNRSLRRVAVSSMGRRVLFEDSAGNVGAVEVVVESRRALVEELGERWNDLEIDSAVAVDGGVAELDATGRLTRFDLRLVRDDASFDAESPCTAIAIAGDGRWAVASRGAVHLRTPGQPLSQIRVSEPVRSIAFADASTWCATAAGIRTISADGVVDEIASRPALALETLPGAVLAVHDDGTIARWEGELPVEVGQVPASTADSMRVEIRSIDTHFVANVNGSWTVGSMRSGRTSFSCENESVLAIAPGQLVRRQATDQIAIDSLKLRDREVALSVPAASGSSLTALGAGTVGTIRLLFWTMLIAIPIVIFVAIDASELSGRARRRRILSANHFIGGTPAVAIALFFSQIIAPLLRANAVRVVVVLAILPFALAIAAPLSRAVSSKLGSAVRGRALLGVGLSLFLALVSGPISILVQENFLGESPERYLEGVGPSYAAWFLLLYPVLGLGFIVAVRTILRRAVARRGPVSARVESLLPAIGTTISFVLTILGSLLAARVLGHFWDPRGPWLAGGIDWAPFGRGSSSTILAACAVAVVATPVMISATVGLFRSVPTEFRIASYGVGASRIQTVVRLVMAVTWPGLIGVFLLGAARAIGETMAVLWLIERANPESSSGLGLFGSFSTLTQFIVDEVRKTDGEVPTVVLLAAAAVFFSTLILNAVGEVLRTRYRQ